MPRPHSAREKRIKTNSAVKINLNAYKSCHNYHLNAIVPAASFISAADATHRDIVRVNNVPRKIRCKGDAILGAIKQPLKPPRQFMDRLTSARREARP